MKATKDASVVVTGVSSGIGRGAAEELIACGFRVFGSVRKKEIAERLRTELGERFTPLLFDVTDAGGVARAAKQVEHELGTAALYGLVNNAGVAVPGPLVELPVSELRRNLEVNLLGVMTVTQAFLPLLRRGGKPRDGARIVNITSVAGKIGLPFLGPYVAAKHALEGLSQSLRRELMLYGIDVVLIDPGTVATPIWDKAEETDAQRFAGSPFLPAMLRFQEAMITSGRRGTPPRTVGVVVRRALTVRRPRARYAMGSGRIGSFLGTGIVPIRWLDRFVARRLRLSPQSTSPTAAR